MAEVEYLHVCDYAFQSVGGKPCIIGIFDNIKAASFPATHPVMVVSVQLRATPHERIPLQISLTGPNGDAIIRSVGETTAGTEGGAFVNFTMIGTTFPGPGRYSVTVVSGDRQLASQSIRVQLGGPAPEHGPHN